MLEALRHTDSRSRNNLIALLLFLGVALLFGGASRADALSQPVVRLAAIALIAFVMATPGGSRARDINVPLFLLLALGVIITVQLIPLPPELWTAFPGRQPYLAALAAAGIEPGWRPLSLTPDLTLNSLLAVLPPLAVALAMSRMDHVLYRVLIPVILIGTVVSALFGLVQISGSKLYLYRVTNLDSAVGVFANRNHQALLLTAAFPLLACWAASGGGKPDARRIRAWVALCMAAAIVPLLLVTGSRAGLLLGVLALPIAGFLAVGAIGGLVGRGREKRWAALLAIVPMLIAAVAAIATWAFSRDEALRRLLGTQNQDSRITTLPVLLEMARDFFPIGSGFGSFDSVYRLYEPHDQLTTSYLNQAHNDPVQLVIEGGLVAATLFTVLLVWFLWRTVAVWRSGRASRERLLGRTGSAVIFLILLSSLVDYPLRTPLFSVLIVIASMWLQSENTPGDHQRVKE